MDLILWRHAEAFDPEEGQDDLHRRLTPRGEKHAERMARWLEQQLPEGTRILCSPAVRTEQTVQALKRKYKVRDALAPGATVQDVLETAGWPDAKYPVLLVGHQPTLGQTIAQNINLAGKNQWRALAQVFSNLCNGCLVWPRWLLNRR